MLLLCEMLILQKVSELDGNHPLLSPIIDFFESGVSRVGILDTRETRIDPRYFKLLQNSHHVFEITLYKMDRVLRSWNLPSHKCRHQRRKGWLIPNNFSMKTHGVFMIRSANKAVCPQSWWQNYDLMSHFLELAGLFVADFRNQKSLVLSYSCVLAKERTVWPISLSSCSK